MNLKKLILKASLGDKKSLDFIAEKYQNYVCFFCSTVISDSQKAENAFKKSFKAVFSAIEKNPKVDNLDEIVTYETARVCKGFISDEKNSDNILLIIRVFYLFLFSITLFLKISYNYNLLQRLPMVQSQV